MLKIPDFHHNVLESFGIPEPSTEYQFHPTRRWRLDFAWPEQRLAVEIEGAIFGRTVVCHKCHSKVMRKLKTGKWISVREGGRHSTGAGMASDMEKYDALTEAGWRLLRYQPGKVDYKQVANVLSNYLPLNVDKTELP